jgi:creatinine amidohydrolase
MNHEEPAALHWEEMSSPEVSEYVAGTPMVIWPFGAVEQHGPHLPLITDALHASTVAGRVSAATGVAVLPSNVYGNSYVHGSRFPGTLSVRPQTLMAVIEDVCEGLLLAGVRKIFFLNGHGGNSGPLISSLQNLRYDYSGEIQFKLMNWYDVPSIAHLMFRDVSTGDKYIHAGWSETSLVLAMRPGLVRMEHAVNEQDIHTHFDYTLEQVTRSGVMGSATTDATPVDGERIIALAVAELTQIVKEMLTEQPPIDPSSSTAPAPLLPLRQGAPRIRRR